MDIHYSFFALAFLLLVAVQVIFNVTRPRGVPWKEMEKFKSEIDSRISRISEKINLSNENSQALFRDIMAAIGELRGRLPR